MTLKDLLGLPLSAAQEAAERAHLPLPRLVYTRAQGEKRLQEEQTSSFEDRVIGCREDMLILGRFRTAQPEEALPDGAGSGREP